MMKFSYLASVFDAIAKTSSRTEMTQLLAGILHEANAHEAEVISHLSLGELRAPHKGNKFNFAEKNMFKALVSLLQIDSVEAKTLYEATGDIGTFIQQTNWPYTDSGIHVLQVYRELESFEEISGMGSIEEKVQALKKIFQQLDQLSASFVARIIVGTLRLGFSDMTLIDAFSWVLAGDKSYRGLCEDAYNMCADIGYIAYLTKFEGVEGLKKVQPVMGIPIRPASAERSSSARAIVERLGTCVAQPKLDGFRLQIHIQNDGGYYTWFFSRNLLDMSNMFPDVAQAFQGLAVKNIIIEGEAIAYDEATDSFVPFQETVKRKRKHNIEEVAKDLPLKFFIFDILYLNDESLMGYTHAQRREVLHTIFADYTTYNAVIKVIEEVNIDNARMLEDYFNLQISQGLEGIVVKRTDAIYQPGKRNFNWIKLKRQEEGHLDDTIDAVVLGYYLGKGKRTGFGIGAFLVGLYNPDTDRYETVAKIGTGLKDADWVDLKERCDAIVVKQQPNNVICASELAPQVWVSPRLVVIVRADEITRSPLHAVDKTDTHNGLALRFPRFMGYADKLPTQATTDKELRRLFELQYARKEKN